MKNTPVSRPYGRCSCGREVWAAQWSETRKRVEIDCACGSTETIKPSATHPAKVLMAASAFALLGGCAGFTSEMLQQDVRIGVGVIRAVSCSVAVNGGFGSQIIQTADAIACQASGGTVVR